MVSLTRPSLGESISNYQISGQSFKDRNCHNSRTSHVTDMKLVPVTKLDKRNTKTRQRKKNDDDVASENSDVIDFFFNLWLICSNAEDGFWMHGL